MTAHALVVPTRGDRPYLADIVANAGCPVIIVATVPDFSITLTSELIRGLPVRLLVDLGDVNIQRWWNRGIERAGTDHVAIVNDDITLPPGIVQSMSARLDETGASICYPCSSNSTGWCFMLNVSHGIRPDERFRWYYGDNDLHEQALRLGGVCDVGVAVPHHTPGQRTPQFADLVAADEQEFRTKWSVRAH